MPERHSLWRWVKVAGAGGATLAWAFLFYANYWNASVVAFGNIDAHLADLRLLFWKYVGVGSVLAVAWVAALMPQRQKQRETRRNVKRRRYQRENPQEKVRMRG